jgi:hypothetical protein
MIPEPDAGALWEEPAKRDPFRNSRLPSIGLRDRRIWNLIRARMLSLMSLLVVISNIAMSGELPSLLLKWINCCPAHVGHAKIDNLDVLAGKLRA